MINKIIINWYEFSTNTDIILENTYLLWNEMSNKTTFNYPYRSWIWVISNNFWQNGIYVKGILKWTSKFDLNNKLDLMLRKIYTEDQVSLEVYVQTDAVTEVKRVWTARMITPNPVNQENWMINIIEFEFEMALEDWYIEDELYTTVASTINYLPYTVWFNMEWTFKTYPIFEFTILYPNQTFIEIAWVNTIRVDNAFIINDVLTFDWETKEVRLNNVLIDYSGIFPYFKPWYNGFEFKIDEAFAASFSYKYKQKYIK